MHSCTAYIISIALDENTHSPIAYNTIIVIINVFYKLEDMLQAFMIFLLCIEVLELRNKLSDMQQEAIYFRGCYDSVGYLKKAGIL